MRSIPKGKLAVGVSSPLIAYERRLGVEVDRILYQNYLSPRTVTDFWAGDRAAIVWHLKLMKERVIRLVVINEYIEVDEELNRAILKRVSPKGPRAKRAVLSMLRRLFMKQKVEHLIPVPTCVDGGVVLQWRHAESV